MSTTTKNNPGAANTLQHQPTTTGLRRLLQANAGFSMASGLTALIGGSAVADMAEVDQVWLVQGLGAGLALFAAAVAVVASGGLDRLRFWTPLISAADIAWVIGTAVVVALGLISATGSLVAIGLGAIVAVFGIGQLRGLRALAR